MKCKLLLLPFKCSQNRDAAKQTLQNLGIQLSAKKTGPARGDEKAGYGQTFEWGLPHREKGRRGSYSIAQWSPKPGMYIPGLHMSIHLNDSLEALLNF